MKALLSAVLLSVIGVLAYADNAANNGAFVVDLGAETCRVPDGNFTPVFASQGIFTATLSQNNNMLVSCRGHDPAFAATDGQTRRFTDFNCTATHPLIGELVAHKSFAVVTPSGSVQMKCHFRFGG